MQYFSLLIIFLVFIGCSNENQSLEKTTLNLTLDKQYNLLIDKARFYRYNEINYTKMEELYKKASKININNNLAFFELAIFHYLKNNTKKTILTLKKFNSSGYMGFNTIEKRLKNYTLGYIYYRNLQEYEKALSSFTLNSLHINIYPLLNVYDKLQRDNKLKKYNYKDKEYLISTYKDKYKLIDISEIEYYKIQNSAESNYQLARIYRYLFIDFKKAIFYYKKAHNFKHELAAFELAELYNRKFNDIAEAIKWYKKSHLIGNKNAAFYLALFYDLKLRAFDKAINWYKEAYKIGHKAAAVNISLIYKYSLKNEQKYLIWKGN